MVLRPTAVCWPKVNIDRLGGWLAPYAADSLPLPLYGVPMMQLVVFIPPTRLGDGAQWLCASWWKCADNLKITTSIWLRPCAAFLTEFLEHKESRP